MLPRSWKWAWWAALFIALVVRLLALADWRRPIDDSYIELRYAWNVAHHGGWFYNGPHELAQGATSLLWVLALVPAALFLGPGDPRGTAILSVANPLVELLLLVWLLWKARQTPARARELMIGALLFVMGPTVIDLAPTGMEASLAMALVSVAWVSPYGSARWAVALGLLAITRPETSVTVAAPLLFALLVAEVRRAGKAGLLPWLRVAGLAVAPGIAALAVVSALRGWTSPIPTTLTAKSATYDMLKPAPILADYLGRGSALTGLAMSALPWWVAGLLLVGFAVLVTREVLARRDMSVTGWGLAWVACILYYVAAIRWWYPWYSAVAAAISLWFLAGALGRLRVPTIQWATAAAAGLIFCVDAVKVRHFAARVLGAHVPVAEEWSGVGIGRALRTMAAPDKAVMLEPVGFIGYMSGMQVIDTVGLVSSEVTKIRAAGPCWYDRAVQQLQPDFIVVREAEIETNKDFLSSGTKTLGCTSGPIPPGYSRALERSTVAEDTLALLRRDIPRTQ